MTTTETVFVVDDDLSVREALSSLIRSVGFQVHTFSSAVEFLQYARPACVSCVVLDVRMPGLSGLDLQGAFSRSGESIPIKARNVVTFHASHKLKATVQGDAPAPDDFE